MRIEVVGDVGTDWYHIGRVRGLSAEAPIPIIDQTKFKHLPGMGWNVEANLLALGAKVEVIKSNQLSFPSKNRLLTEDGIQLARWDYEDTCQPIDPNELMSPNLLDAIIVADYGKGAVHPKLVKVLLQHSHRIPVFIDTKGNPDVWAYWAKGPNVTLFPNQVEFARYHEEYTSLHRVVLKRGAEGIRYIETTNSLTRPTDSTRFIHDLPAYARWVRCVNGAGDTTIASFALAQAEGRSLPECLQYASAAAANVVEQPWDQRTTTASAIADRLRGINGTTQEETTVDTAAHLASSLDPCQLSFAFCEPGSDALIEAAEGGGARLEHNRANNELGGSRPPIPINRP